MPSPKSYRKGGQEKNKKVISASEKSSSFPGRGDKVVSNMLPRPQTVPDLLTRSRSGGIAEEEVVAQGRPLKLTKLLVNVTIQRSPGAVQVVMSPEATVKGLIAVALRQYVKEARRPVLPSTDALGFELHYSQFSLENLDMEEKLTSLGSRNFFLCPKKKAEMTTCSKEGDNATKKSLTWLKFMDFLL